MRCCHINGSRRTEEIYENIMIYTVVVPRISWDILRYHRIFSYETFQIVEKWLWPFTMRCDQLNIKAIFLWVSQHLSLDQLRVSLSALRSFKLDLVLLSCILGLSVCKLNLSDFIFWMFVPKFNSMIIINLSSAMTSSWTAQSEIERTSDLDSWDSVL